MLYLLTLDGVPVGQLTAPDPAPAWYASRLETLLGPGDGTGLMLHALRIGEWISLTHGPRPRPSPRQRRMGAELEETRPRWRDRLGLLDRWGVHVPVARVEVIWFPGKRPFVTLDFRLSLGQVGAVHRIMRLVGATVEVPAA